MASAELLKMTQSVDGKVVGVDSRVKGVDDRVKGVEEKVQDVHNGVQDVRDDVQDVRDNVQDVCEEVQGVREGVQNVDHRVQSIGSNISRRVQGVDNKLDQVNRSLFLYFPPPVPSIHPSSQGTTSERIFYDGFHPQIRPPTITSHATLITTVPLDGFFKDLYSINGSPLGPCCGYTESVRTLGPHQASSTPDHRSSLNSVAGSGKSILWLVVPQPFSTVVKLTSIQFVDHRRYRSLARHWEGVHGLFLL